jgi:hypothetical protein
MTCEQRGKQVNSSSLREKGKKHETQEKNKQRGWVPINTLAKR